MSRLLVKGRQKLSGEVSVQGAKNSALPILAATVLAKGESVLYHCPALSDVDGHIVAARQGKQLAAAFHPELTADNRMHRYFVDSIRA